jgi:hypothetical protein
MCPDSVRPFAAASLLNSSSNGSVSLIASWCSFLDFFIKRNMQCNGWRHHAHIALPPPRRVGIGQVENRPSEEFFPHPLDFEKGGQADCRMAADSHFAELTEQSIAQLLFPKHGLRANL